MLGHLDQDIKKLEECPRSGTAESHNSSVILTDGEQNFHPEFTPPSSKEVEVRVFDIARK